MPLWPLILKGPFRLQSANLLRPAIDSCWKKLNIFPTILAQCAIADSQMIETNLSGP